MTDIDDTIVPSGVMPDEGWIEWLSDKLRCLRDHNIAWIPMTGVAIDKLAPRILSRLPQDVCSHIIYYGGDGSQKHFFDPESQEWVEDLSYRRILTDAQTLAILGESGFLHALRDDSGSRTSAEARLAAAQKTLEEGQFSGNAGILEEMASILEQHGHDAAEAETYFRGGSISWMMLGDVAVEPYQRSDATATRAHLLEYAKKRLDAEDHLVRFGTEAVHIPFHGSRGIKFVLRDNDKERGTRDLMAQQGLSPEEILFTGNELFDGGNDHVITRVEGVTLVSVGERFDPGPNIINAGVGISIYDALMESICNFLEQGDSWRSIISGIRTQQHVLS
jgi:hypothetical protein